MIHSHLNFYSNSSSSGFAKPITLGGTELTPGLIEIKGEGFEGGDLSHHEAREKSTLEKHIEIVEYLKRLPRGVRATFVDFQNDLRIDLNEDINVLNIIRNNSKIDQQADVDGTLSFAYRAKFEITNKRELQTQINYVKSGIVLADIIDCYKELESDVNDLIIGGDIIANKFKEAKSLVLYPRGTPFLTQLSGTVTATPGRIMTTTSESLLNEIRRGEAVKVSTSWYRLSSAIGSGEAHQQNQRSTAPTSVTSDINMSDKNVYYKTYSEHSLPLDGEFEETEVFTGHVFKHGCTNDIKECWKQTIEGGFKAFQGGQDSALEKELVTLGLLPKSTNGNSQSNDTLKRKSKQDGGNKKKQVRKSKSGMLGAGSNTNFGVNAHLRGGTLERILKETRDKEEAAANHR